MHIYVSVLEEVNIGMTVRIEKILKKMFVFKRCITLIDKLIIRNFFIFLLSFYFLIQVCTGYVVIFSFNLFTWENEKC